ncbi:MAG: TonB-dependent receptor, partial [Planctomycetaceae bacterium]|nr:TonB-dependent receptor [Planctomycetaceae bacterium]
MARTARIAILLALLWPYGTAWTQDDATRPPVLDPTDVIAPFPRHPLSGRAVLSSTRTEILRERNGSSVTVISGKALRRSGKALLHEALRGVPGLDVVRAGGPGQQTSIFIRGTESRHTKVLLDGIPLNDPSSPSRAFDFSNLAVENIERVEILRGPQSTLYGSDAIGGVVNIVTRRGQGAPRYRFRTLGGRYGTFQQSASVSGSTDRTYYSLGGSYLESDGFTTAAPRFGNTENDGVRNGNLSGRFGWLLDKQNDIDVVFRYTDAESQIDGFLFPIGTVDDLARKLKNETFAMRTQLRREMLDGAIEQKVGFSFSNFNRRDTSPGLFGTPAFDGQTIKFDWQANLLLYESERIRNVLTTGVDHLDEEGASTGSPRESMYGTGVFVQEQVVLNGNWSSVVGARWDRYSRAGAAKTYRVTSRYSFEDNGTALHASLG